MSPSSPTFDNPTAVTDDYAPTDLVYVDPKNRAIVGRVEFAENGIPKKREMPMAEPELVPARAEATPPADGAKQTANDRRSMRLLRKRYCPWGTVKSVTKIYKIGGKVPDVSRACSLDEAIAKAMAEPYWD